MEPTIEYCQARKSIFVRNNTRKNFHMTDERLVQHAFTRDSLMIATMKLDNMEGEIRLTDDDWFSIPVTGQHMDHSFVLEGDTLLVTFSNVILGIRKILVINLDTRQYDEYPGFDQGGKAVGIDGDIIYLSNVLSDYQGTVAKIVGFNVKTQEMGFEYRMCGGSLVHSSHRICDGRRAIVRSVRKPNFGMGCKVVSIPDGEVHLEIEEPIRDEKCTRYGVFYVSEGENRYYSTFNGETYRVNFEIDQTVGVRTAPGVEIAPSVGPRMVPDIFSASDDAQSIWLEYLTINGDLYLVNYKLSQDRRQKSARSQA